MLQPLAPEKLRTTCDPATLGFQTTADLSPLEEFIDQETMVLPASSFAFPSK